MCYRFSKSVVHGLRTAEVGLDIRVEHHSAIFQSEVVNFHLSVSLVNTDRVPRTVCTVVFSSNRARKVVFLAHLELVRFSILLLHTVAFGFGAQTCKIIMVVLQGSAYYQKQREPLFLLFQ